jgi:hypothetical protein
MNLEYNNTLTGAWYAENVEVVKEHSVTIFMYRKIKVSVGIVPVSVSEHLIPNT